MAVPCPTNPLGIDSHVGLEFGPRSKRGYSQREDEGQGECRRLHGSGSSLLPRCRQWELGNLAGTWSTRAGPRSSTGDALRHAGIPAGLRRADLSLLKASSRRAGLSTVPPSVGRGQDAARRCAAARTKPGSSHPSASGEERGADFSFWPLLPGKVQSPGGSLGPGPVQQRSPMGVLLLCGPVPRGQAACTQHPAGDG